MSAPSLYRPRPLGIDRQVTPDPAEPEERPSPAAIVAHATRLQARTALAFGGLFAAVALMMLAVHGARALPFTGFVALIYALFPGLAWWLARRTARSFAREAPLTTGTVRAARTFRLARRDLFMVDLDFQLPDGREGLARVWARQPLVDGVGLTLPMLVSGERKGLAAAALPGDGWVSGSVRQLSA